MIDGDSDRLLHTALHQPVEVPRLGGLLMVPNGRSTISFQWVVPANFVVQPRGVVLVVEEVTNELACAPVIGMSL